MGVNKVWNLYKAGKKAKTISSVPPTFGSTGTSSLIKKYKKHVAKFKVPHETKAEAAKIIHKFSRKHGLTKTDVEIGKKLKD